MLVTPMEVQSNLLLTEMSVWTMRFSRWLTSCCFNDPKRLYTVRKEMTGFAERDEQIGLIRFLYIVCTTRGTFFVSLVGVSATECTTSG